MQIELAAVQGNEVCIEARNVMGMIAGAGFADSSVVIIAVKQSAATIR